MCIKQFEQLKKVILLRFLKKNPYTQIMIGIFTTREFAHISLFGFVLMLVLIKNPKILRSIKELIMKVFQAFFVLDFFTIYELLVLFCIIHLSFWQGIYLKNFIIWLVLGGFPALTSIYNKSIAEFKMMIYKQFFFASFVEFLSGLVTFSLFLEYILCIISTLLILVSVVDKTEKVTKYAQFILAMIGILLIVMTIVKAINQFARYNSFQTLIEFALPIFFYCSSIPFLYFFLLYSKYDHLFLVINHLEKNNTIKKSRKLEALRWCGINTDRVKDFLTLFTSNPAFTSAEFKDYVNKKITLDQLLDKWYVE